ncbi:hypothetical protein Purlil1_13820 [Purpureocillium lilacinum]|uniref:Reverse transcriptase n=1 Tax=Purpureocillium lilacinum TaxID=33203 RepID=A0ABR0BD29_PURLI|nr:hypothetical protein Purlil1_13820 [Purpureocillium lilacinum]
MGTFGPVVVNNAHVQYDIFLLGCSRYLNRSHTRPREAIQKTIHDREVNSWTQEQICPFVAPPWWQGPQTYIEETAEEARKKHLGLLRQERAALHICTDGSGINGQIGAAAVCPTIQQTRSSYIGTEDVSTVYAGELQVIPLALDIAQQDRADEFRRNKVIMYTDNQAAIRSSAKPKGISGAYLLKKIVSQDDTARTQLANRDTMGSGPHRSARQRRRGQGSQRSHRMARERSTGAASRDARGALLPPFHTGNMDAQRSPQGLGGEVGGGGDRQDLIRLHPKPTKKVLRLHDGLNKRQSVLLVQLRTEKIGLKDLPLQPRSAEHGRQLPMPGRTPNGVAHPAAMPHVSITPAPGTRSPARTTRPPGHIERAQGSRKGHQVHGTDGDPWAIQDRVPHQTKLSIGGRL